MTKQESPEGSVYVVVPVRNRWTFTQACIESLRRQTYPRVHVVCVDDASSDGTPERLRADYPEVTLIEGDGNLWWTGATNVGVRWVLDRCSDDDFVLLLNNDTRVSPGYVATLIRLCDERERKALVGSVGIDARDGDTIFDGGPTVEWPSARWRSRNVGRSLAETSAEGIRSTTPSVLPGRGTLVPVACFREIGLFDERRLPHYAADYEFSARAARNGYALVMSYEAPVYSEVEATGPSSARGPLPWGRFWQTYVSRRSPACLLYRWRFGLLAAPKGVRGLYLLTDTARVIIGGLRVQLGVKR